MPQIAKGTEVFKDDGTADITRVSVSSRIERTVNLPITRAQYDAWKNGEMIQDAMPQLSSSQREFLMTGLTDEEFKAMWGSEEEEEDEDDN